MRKFFKWLTICLACFVVVLVAGIGYLKFRLPHIDTPASLKVEQTSERVERGRYLANHVTVCIDCHSRRDWSK